MKLRKKTVPILVVSVLAVSVAVGVLVFYSVRNSDKTPAPTSEQSAVDSIEQNEGTAVKESTKQKKQEFDSIASKAGSVMNVDDLQKLEEADRPLVAQYIMLKYTDEKEYPKAEPFMKYLMARNDVYSTEALPVCKIIESALSRQENCSSAPGLTAPNVIDNDQDPQEQG